MNQQMLCTLITWDKVDSLCRQLVGQLRKANCQIDGIVAIGRGGYVPGRILSDMLGIFDLTSFKIEHYQGAYKQHEAFVKYSLNTDISGRNILLLDDVSDSGDTFAVALDHVMHCGTVKKLCTASLHFKTVSTFIPDFYAETVNEWRWLIYPWAVNEDLSSLITKMKLDNPDVRQLQRLFKQRHDINVTYCQIEDALVLLQGEKK
ncbi:phosphoribosyltransferase [Methylobacter sp. S3L5C]|uniref:phosphoribosyltransferase n=1 Tax=Methylobacter sp. S3L5C TaxID=2839024 RepID=UPI001FABCD52|nr:phosphoribosyltransferase [Methylobacter sp. S3L5C]UOA08629.1 phosphoribosyltransferase [Methylobacter sp. S3L5C]